MHKLLLVDDEQNILNALRRELESEYDIETFTNPADALERCQDTQFDLVISDYRMPDMNGIELLAEVARIQTDAARLLLSGQADIQVLVNAINKTHVYRFISKPWDTVELKTRISQALAYRAILLDNQRISAAYREKHKLPDVHEIASPYHIILMDDINGTLSRMWAMTRHICHQNINAALWRDLPHQGAAAILDTDLVVKTFSSETEALEYAGQNACDLVVALQKLTEMSAPEFLKKFMQLQPDAARLLLSNNPDMETISQSINDAEVNSFLFLSWDQSSGTKGESMRQSWNACQLKVAVLKALISRELILENRRLAGLLRDES